MTDMVTQSIQNIAIDTHAIAAFCRKHHIQKLALFGSVLRDDFRANSDVDVLFTFEPDHTPGYIRLGMIEEELSLLLAGHKIDFVSEQYLHAYIRDAVLSEAVVIYEG